MTRYQPYTSLLLAILAFGVIACVNQPSKDADVQDSSGAPPTGGDGSAASSGVAVEFKTLRTKALQTVTEENPKLGKKLTDLCAKVEQEVGKGAAGKANDHLFAMLAELDGAGLTGSAVTGVYSALATDLDTVKSDAGAPTVKITQTKDKCCGTSGTCDTASPGATCFSASAPKKSSLCACRTSGGAAKTSRGSVGGSGSGSSSSGSGSSGSGTTGSGDKTPEAGDSAGGSAGASGTTGSE